MSLANTSDTWIHPGSKMLTRGLLKALRIESEGLLDQKRDCTAILMQILRQANIRNVFSMGSDAPEDPSFHKLWHKAWGTGLAFIYFHPHGDRLSGINMGIQRNHNPLALRHRQVKDDKHLSLFALSVVNMVGNTTTIANHLWQDHYKLGMVCLMCKSHITTCHEDLKSHIIQCTKEEIKEQQETVVLVVSVPFLQLSSYSITNMAFYILTSLSPNWRNMPKLVSFYEGCWTSMLPLQM